jgi:hypothetical protein
MIALDSASKYYGAFLAARTENSVTRCSLWVVKRILV